MQWVKYLLDNKKIVYLLTLLTCVVGIVCLSMMSIAPFPPIQWESMTIRLSYPSANAQTLQQQVIKKILPGLQAINNINKITTTAQSGSARMDLVLNHANDNEVLRTQIKIMQVIAASQLPSAVATPSIELHKGQSSLVNYNISSDTASLFDIQNFIAAVLVPKFRTFPDVILRGTFDADPVVKISLDPQAIAFYHLDPLNINQIINQHHRSSPLGHLHIDKQNYQLNMHNQVDTLAALGEIVVGYRTGEPHHKHPSDVQVVRLRQIADIRLAPRDGLAHKFSQSNGKTAAFLWVNTQSLSDPFSVNKQAADFIKRLRDKLPHNIVINKTFDMAALMQTSIDEVMITILIASLLVLAVAAIFLGRLKVTLIPIATIPVCLLGALIIVYSCGFSLNILTLMALVLAVGLVVDDAIVVVENISRYLEQGMNKYDAVVHGTTDIAYTVIGITLTLIAVYVPIVFLDAQVVVLFRLFAVTLAAAVFISGIFSLTLTPVMSLLLLNNASANNYQKAFEKRLKIIIAYYHRVLCQVLGFSKRTLCVVIIVVLCAGWFIVDLPKKVFPTDPNGYISVNIAGMPQDSMDSMREKVHRLRHFMHDKRIRDYYVDIAAKPTTGLLDAKIGLLMDPEQRKQTLLFVEEVKQYIKQHKLTNISVRAYNVANMGGDFDLSYYVYTDADAGALSHQVEKIKRAMQAMDMFSMVASDSNHMRKQLSFSFNSVKAASLGIERAKVMQLLSNYFAGFTLDNHFSIAGLDVPIVIQLNDKDLQDPQVLEKLMIQSPLNNKYYPLSSIISTQLVVEPLSIMTLNGKLATVINANLNKGYTVADSIAAMDSLFKDGMPRVKYQYTGNALHYLESSNQSLMIGLLGMACVYLLLFLLFNNLIDPLIILLTVPFAVVGGALSLYLIDGSINLYSTLALITLVGLITKHGILIVKFANQSLKQGHSVHDAILLATRYRFRPIIMTTFAMILGAVPLLFGSHLFYMARMHLGVVIIGGLIVGTLFSLFVIPLVYALMKRDAC